MTKGAPLLVLASGSASRAALLRRAGLCFETEAAAIDETEIKASFRAEGSKATDCAVALAEAKATSVSRRRPGALVIGADQILVCNGAWFDKPPDRAAASDQLRSLRGCRHELVSAVCVVENGARLWRFVDCPRLTMRAFTDDFLADYLAAAGDEILASVGAYQLEGLGVQLFAEVDGDFFSILGLPLLPLLEFLRGRGVVTR
ncbi:MAG TPA: Maf family protein [Stellaceae bacterium]|nr:Maf family protein [Stellaceae bacterium]